MIPASIKKDVAFIGYWLVKMIADYVLKFSKYVKKQGYRIEALSKYIDKRAGQLIGLKLVLIFNGKQQGSSNMNFSVDNQIVCSLAEADQFGDAEAVQVAPDAPPQWSVDNPALADIALASDGVSALITPKGAGVINVAVAASFGGKALNGSGQLTLVPGAVAQLTIGFAAAQAPAAPVVSAQMKK